MLRNVNSTGRRKMGRYYHYDRETGTSMAKFSKQGIVAYGTAKVHPDDQKFASEFTGLTLAEMRAYKNFLHKRAMKKKSRYLKYEKITQSYKAQYEEDLQREKEMDEFIASFIKDKEELHRKLSNPVKRTEWKELPEDFFEGIELNEELRAVE